MKEIRFQPCCLDMCAQRFRAHVTSYATSDLHTLATVMGIYDTCDNGRREEKNEENTSSWVPSTRKHIRREDGPYLHSLVMIFRSAMCRTCLRGRDIAALNKESSNEIRRILNISWVLDFLGSSTQKKNFSKYNPLHLETTRKNKHADIITTHHNFGVNTFLKSTPYPAKLSQNQNYWLSLVKLFLRKHTLNTQKLLLYKN